MIVKWYELQPGDVVVRLVPLTEYPNGIEILKREESA